LRSASDKKGKASPVNTNGHGSVSRIGQGVKRKAAKRVPAKYLPVNISCEAVVNAGKVVPI